MYTYIYTHTFYTPPPLEVAEALCRAAMSRCHHLGTAL